MLAGVFLAEALFWLRGTAAAAAETVAATGGLTAGALVSPAGKSGRGEPRVFPAEALSSPRCPAAAAGTATATASFTAEAIVAPEGNSGRGARGAALIVAAAFTGAAPVTDAVAFTCAPAFTATVAPASLAVAVAVIVVGPRVAGGST